MNTLFQILIIAALVISVLSLVFRRRQTKVHFANIGEGTRETGHWSALWDTTTATALAAALAANTTSGGRFLLVKKSTDGDHITTCGAGDISIGICIDAYDPNNTDQPVTVALHGCSNGTQRVVTDGNAVDGGQLLTGANGQATTSTTASAGTFGKAFIGTDETLAAGDIIGCITVVPFKYAF